MANYSQLAQFIDDRIYDNDNNAITGSGLNYVLNRMVEILGNGFLFSGVIDPESSILTPDTNIFYVGFAGTYGQFASQTYTVGPGEIGFFAYDGTWHVGIGRVGGGGGGDFDANSLRLVAVTLPATAIDEIDLALQYNIGTTEDPNWYTLSTITINKADIYSAGLIDRDGYRRLYADNHQNKTDEFFPYCFTPDSYAMGAKSFYAACIKELWLDPTVYGDRSQYQAEYMGITKFQLRKLVNGQRVCAFKIQCLHIGEVGAPIETIIDYSVLLPADPSASTLVTPPSLIHNDDNTCVAVINWNAIYGFPDSSNFRGYESTWPTGALIEAPDVCRLSEDLALFDLGYCPTIKQYLEGGGGSSFDYEKLQLYLNLNMTNKNRQVVGLRYNAGTVQTPDYESLGNVALELAETTGWAGLIDGYSYYYLRAKLQQTKPQNNFPLKADQGDNFKTHSRVIDELWIDSTAYTPQQIQAMRVNRLLVNYDDNGDTVCEFRIIVPSNLSDLTQPWDVVIGYREVVTSSNRPSRVIFNASKTVWAVINWNNTLVADGEYINHSDSEGTSSPFLDDTGKITDLNYAPTVQTCLELEKKVQSSTLDGLEALTDSAYSNLPSVDSRTLYITY